MSPFPFRVPSPTSRSAPFGAGALPARVSFPTATSPERALQLAGLFHPAPYSGRSVQGLDPDPQRLPTRRRVLPPCRWASRAPTALRQLGAWDARSPLHVHERSPRLRGFVPRIDRMPTVPLSLSRWPLSLFGFVLLQVLPFRAVDPVYPRHPLLEIGPPSASCRPGNWNRLSRDLRPARGFEPLE